MKTTSNCREPCGQIPKYHKAVTLAAMTQDLPHSLTNYMRSYSSERLYHFFGKCYDNKRYGNRGDGVWDTREKFLSCEAFFNCWLVTMDLSEV